MGMINFQCDSNKFEGLCLGALLPGTTQSLEEEGPWNRLCCAYVRRLKERHF